MELNELLPLITGSGGALVGCVTVIIYLKNEKEKTYILLIEAYNSRIKTLESIVNDLNGRYNDLLKHVINTSSGSNNNSNNNNTNYPS